MPIRAVIDTNVVVSSLIVVGSPPEQVLEALRRSQFALVLSRALADEYTRALSKPKATKTHQMDDFTVRRYVRQLEQASEMVEPASTRRVVQKDADDDAVVACAVAGGADFIVTGDRHLLDMRVHSGIHIVTPAMFLSLLERS